MPNCSRAYWRVRAFPPAWPLGPAHAVKAPWPIGGGYDDPLRIMVNRSDLARARTIHGDFEQAGIDAAEAGASPGEQ